MVYQFFSGQGPRGEADATLVDAVALDFFGGFTRLDTVGGWKAPDGTVYQEPGVVWIIDTAYSTAPQVFAQKMRNLLRQEAILVIAYPSATSHLVTAREEEK